MVLAIDIGNTTIAFTGLEPRFGEEGDISGVPLITEEVHFHNGLPSDYEICFTEKIPTQTGKDLPSFMEAA
ncbi:MAG: hypothetical protein Q4F51_09895, partial [Sarcina sp.]|nr:hypothetical protein [Sarcina sp.]